MTTITLADKNGKHTKTLTFSRFPTKPTMQGIRIVRKGNTIVGMGPKGTFYSDWEELAGNNKPRILPDSEIALRFMLVLKGVVALCPDRLSEEELKEHKEYLDKTNKQRWDWDALHDFEKLFGVIPGGGLLTHHQNELIKKIRTTHHSFKAGRSL